MNLIYLMAFETDLFDGRQSDGELNEWKSG